MTQWNSLFCLLNPSVTPVETLKQSLIKLEYELYDAFDLIPGKAYPDTIKSFVTPSVGKWTHILIDNETPIDDLDLLAETISAQGLCLLTYLDPTTATITLYQHGQEVGLEGALVDHLLSGKSIDDLQRAVAGKLPLPMIESPTDERSQILAIDDLPPDMRQMAQGINVSGAQKMFQRLTGGLLGRGQADQAQGMLTADKLDWNSADGMKIRGVLACLIEGDDWLVPDFATVRDAYQRHIRKQRRPDARLYPGDEQMMAAVPDALAYTPIYGGQ